MSLVKEEGIVIEKGVVDFSFTTSEDVDRLIHLEEQSKLIFYGSGGMGERVFIGDSDSKEMKTVEGTFFDLIVWNEDVVVGCTEDNLTSYSLSEDMESSEVLLARKGITRLLKIGPDSVICLVESNNVLEPGGDLFIYNLSEKEVVKSLETKGIKNMIKSKLNEQYFFTVGGSPMCHRVDIVDYEKDEIVANFGNSIYKQIIFNSYLNHDKEEILVLGGRERYLHIFEIKSGQELHKIEMKHMIHSILGFENIIFVGDSSGYITGLDIVTEPQPTKVLSRVIHDNSIDKMLPIGKGVVGGNASLITCGGMKIKFIKMNLEVEKEQMKMKIVTSEREKEQERLENEMKKDQKKMEEKKKKKGGGFCTLL